MPCGETAWTLCAADIISDVTALNPQGSSGIAHMPEQTPDIRRSDGRIGRLTAIIVSLTALIGAVFALVSTFSDGLTRISHPTAANGVAGSPPAQPGQVAPPTHEATAGRPGTCLTGFVWRDATVGDHVCVVPDTRKAAAADNGAAGSRISPTDHTYGPQTCIPGYVWRQISPSDRTCVTPDTRKQVLDDNRAAASRVAAP